MERSTLHLYIMIIKFIHKGLCNFYDTGSTKGINAHHAGKLYLVLNALDSASEPDQLMFPSFRLHKLTGRLKGYWSIKVSGNWRITFRFEGTDVTDVNYQDYH